MNKYSSIFAACLMVAFSSVDAQSSTASGLTEINTENNTGIVIKSIDLMNKEISLGGEEVKQDETVAEDESAKNNYIINLQTSDINKLTQMIDANPQSLNTVLYEGNTLAHILLMRRNTTYIPLIIEHINLINWGQYNQRGETVFHQIMKLNNMEAFSEIRAAFDAKEWKKQVAKKSKKSQTSLHLFALYSSDMNIFSELLTENINLEVKDKDKGQTVAHYLSAMNKKQLLEQVLRYGASVQATDIYNESVERYMLSYQDMWAIKTLYPFFIDEKNEALNRIQKINNFSSQ